MSTCAAEPESLSELAQFYACDKGYSGPSNKWAGNNYVDIYQAHFGNRRSEELTILEIGLGVKGPNWRSDIVHGRNPEGGASMKMWASYFPNAKIVGLDINPAEFLNTDRIRTFQVDQGDRKSLKAFLDKVPDLFDFIIDDGSHRADHQQITLEALFPRLKPGGIYFIEDLNDHGFGGRSNNRFSSDAIDTRTLFKQFGKTGEVPEPNAFADTTFLNDVENVQFYCPKPMLRSTDLIREGVRTLIGRGERGIARTEYAPDSELIVALRKRD